VDKRRCAACGRLFVLRKQVREQRYCSAPECQKARRRRWQRDKRRSDADYRANETQAQRRWAARHPGYWHTYRQADPEVVERNRVEQRRRNRARRAAAKSGIAKEDASSPQTAVLSGTYRLIPVAVPGIAKMDANNGAKMYENQRFENVWGVGMRGCPSPVARSRCVSGRRGRGAAGSGGWG
jgi:hypothetical protein